MNKWVSLTLITSTLIASFVLAAEPAEKAGPPLDGFAWLQQFEGTWATEFEGTMRSRTVGKSWIVSEISFQEGEVYSVQTIGYDEKEKKFIGTWIDATSGFLWHYTGALDANHKRLVLEADGPDLADPTKVRKYRDIYSFISNDEIRSESQMLDEQGEWKSFNISTMTRTP